MPARCPLVLPQTWPPWRSRRRYRWSQLHSGRPGLMEFHSVKPMLGQHQPLLLVVQQPFRERAVYMLFENTFCFSFIQVLLQLRPRFLNLLCNSWISLVLTETGFVVQITFNVSSYRRLAVWVEITMTYQCMQVIFFVQQVNYLWLAQCTTLVFFTFY